MAYNGETNGNGEEQAEDLNSFEQAKADARQKYAGNDLRALVVAQDQFRKNKAATEDELKRINAEYDVLRFELVPGKMDEMGIENIKYDDVGRVSLSADVLVSIKPGEKLGLFGWLKKHKLADLIQPAVNSSTLKAFVKGRIKEAKPYPTDFLNITPITRASITPPKAK